MDETRRHVNVNPMDKANIVSQGLFCWLNPLFKKGYKEGLDNDDLYNVVTKDSSEYLGNKLEEAWNKQLKKKELGKEPSLLKALISVFGMQYLLLGLIVLLEEGTKVIQPLLLGGLIRYFVAGSGVTRNDAWMYAGGVSLCAVVLAISHHPYFFTVQRIGMRMRVACCSLMYRKCLRLSNKAIGETTVGQIVNLMSNDVNRFDQSVIFLHFLWVGPLQAIAVLIILWYELGPSVLAGFFVLVLLIPVQGFMGKLFSKLRHKTAIHTDERVKVMNEIITGIRVIKMYCWEKPFGELVEKIRNTELHLIHTKQHVKTTKFVCHFSGSKIMMLLVVMPYLQLTPHPRIDRVYMLSMCCIILWRTWCDHVTSCLEFTIAALVTMVRISKFLLLEELGQSSNIEKSGLRPKPENACVQIKDITAKWDEAVENQTLDKISVEVKSGELVAVIGPVGCGKSSLLMSVLQELPVSKGSIKVTGKVAYVSQQPWIFSGSIRQNITFGAAYDKAKFDKVVKVSALTRDFEIMPQGDATIIGDRGASLSGGQKARVSLARALYMDADIYLLDDPLSAVDTAVGRHIFDKCINGYLKNKPRILVTHQVQFLPIADNIIILKEGRIDGQGNYDDLSKSGVDFAELLKREDEEEESKTVTFPPSGKETVPVENKINQSSLSLASVVEGYEPEAVQLPEQEESRASGTVGFGVYIEYFKAGTGLFKFILLVLVNIAAQVFYIGSDWWLSHWSNQEEARYSDLQKLEQELSSLNLSDPFSSNFTANTTVREVDSYYNIGVFSAIIFAVFVFGLIRALLFFKIAVNASQNLHNQMFNRILRSPTTFFDSNPVGRILNRFSKDIGHMDDILPVTFFDFIQCALLILGIIIVAGGVNPYVFIPCVPLGILFVLVRKYYLKTSRSIKRLEGTTRSPVFSYLSATLQGLHTMRSMNMDEKFMEEFDLYQDKHTEAFFLFLATSRWLAVRLDWLCAGFITAVTFCSVIASDNMSPGLIGLSITYAMTLMGMFQWGVRQSAEVENQMISVERVLEYTKLPMEAELESDKGKKPKPSWPVNGTIKAQNVCLRYSPGGPLVLKDLTFIINGREKIGIVGRTGAGKSSLITMLFRLVEPSGMIEIDGIDIQSIGLHDLRKTIAIIPQDPVLFTGSLRKNLDPFNQHDDSLLWKALDEVKLKEQMSDLPEGLMAEVSEGGVNFSVGQRQLICLARAVLRHNKILMIDEATANVDPITDELIQGTIRTKFRDCTVLTIAHRLHTIMDSDRVMVLDNGNIMEFDEPYTLLKDQQGIFHDMAQQTGKTEFEHLRDMAKDAAEKRATLGLMSNGVSLTTKSTGPDVKSSQVTVKDVHSSLSTDLDQEEEAYELSDIEDSLQQIDDLADQSDRGMDIDTAAGEESSSKPSEDNLDDSLDVDESQTLLKDKSQNRNSCVSDSENVANDVKGSVSDSVPEEDKDDADESEVLLKRSSSDSGKDSSVNV